MSYAEAVLFYSTLGVFALVIGALVAGAMWAIASSIEAAADIRKHGW